MCDADCLAMTTYRINELRGVESRSHPGGHAISSRDSNFLTGIPAKHGNTSRLRERGRRKREGGVA